MKTSTFFATTAVAGVFLMLTADNLTLKQEYTSGHIHMPFIVKPLPAFRFIKEILDRDSYTYENVITVSDRPGQKAAIKNFFYEDGLFNYHVTKDTLFIETNPANKFNHSTHAVVYIYTSNLESITSTNAVFTIDEENKDSLSVIAGGKSEVNINAKKINSISINASATAKIGLFALEAVDHASIQMNDTSKFYASDVLIKQKNMQIAPQASIELKGRSLEDFGVTKTVGVIDRKKL